MIVQNATFTMRVTWTDSVTSNPISLANYFAHMQVRSKVGATGTPLLDLSSEGTAPALIIEPGGATGEIDIRIPATGTATLTKNCVYDLFVINKTDPTDATRLVKGAITLDKSVTVTP